MIWKGEEVYPGVREFAENMKEAIMSAHDAIIASRVQQTVQANKKRRPATFQEGDLVYLSTKNISMPKGRARKLAPKYLGPFPITKVIKEGATYQLGLSDELTKRGVNRAFHASLLRPHVPNDDRRFPGRLPIQIPGFREKPEEWIVDRIVTHHGKGLGSEFLIHWKAGDKTWASYREVAHLNALDRYCELMGVKGVSELLSNYEDPVDSEDEINIIRANACTIRIDKRENENYRTDSPLLSSTHETCLTYHPPSISLSDDMLYSNFTANEVRDCILYERQLNDARLGIRALPTEIPAQWREFQAEQAALMERHHGNPADRRGYTHQPIANDNVSMPANTLETIIRALNPVSRPVPAPAPRTPVPRLPTLRHAPRRPTYTPPTNRGRGGNGGRGRGANRRGRRGNLTSGDPRRHNVTEPQIPTFPSASTSTIPSIPLEIPDNVTDTDAGDLSFFNEFEATLSGTDLSGSDLSTNDGNNNTSINDGDILMTAEAPAEGEFNA